jgi:hypothetical protein
VGNRNREETKEVGSYWDGNERNNLPDNCRKTNCEFFSILNQEGYDPNENWISILNCLNWSTLSSRYVTELQLNKYLLLIPKPKPSFTVWLPTKETKNKASTTQPWSPGVPHPLKRQRRQNMVPNTISTSVVLWISTQLTIVVQWCVLYSPFKVPILFAHLTNINC